MNHTQSNIRAAVVSFRRLEFLRAAIALTTVSALVAGLFVQGLVGAPASFAALEGDEVIETVAGAGEGGPANETLIAGPQDVVFDAQGNNYFIAAGSLVHRVDGLTGVITRVAGHGIQTDELNDGALAVNANVNALGLALDSQTNLYIAEGNRYRIRKVDAGTGIITTVAGTGVQGYSGDGSLAANAQITGAFSVVVDSQDNLYIADPDNNRVRKVDAGTGIITTVAGTGSSTTSGDGGQATLAGVSFPTSVGIDGTDNLYILANNYLRKVDAVTGVITTIAGTGSGIGACPAGSALTTNVGGNAIHVESDGTVYFGRTSCVMKLDLAGNITLVAGTGTQGYSGDGALATSAQVKAARGLGTDQNGSLLFADSGNSRVRRVDKMTAVIDTVAGIGPENFSGEGLQASQAVLPASSVALDSEGNLYVAGANLIIKIGEDGIVSLLAGTGASGDSGDGGPALIAELQEVRDIALSPSGNTLYLTNNDRIRKIDLVTGVIDAFAGDGTDGFGGDGGLALNAALDDPFGLGVDVLGNVYIADTRNERVRKVDTSGIITTVAGGGGTPLNFGTSVPALSLSIDNAALRDVAVDSIGNVYFTEQGGNNHIVRIDTSQMASIFAGHHGVGSSGDGAQAVDAEIGGPHSITVDAEDNVYAAQQRLSSGFPDTDSRVRKIDPVTGIITTVVGTGVTGFSGDGGSANQAMVIVGGIAFSPDGALYLAAGAGRVRRVSSGNAAADFVVLAKEALHLQSGATVETGDVGANTAGGDVLDGGAEVSLGTGVEVQEMSSRVMGETVRLRNNSSAWDVHYNTLINSGSILGDEFTPLVIPLLEMFPEAPEMPENILVDNDATEVVAAGEYARLIAGARSTVTFSGGEYDFSSWDISSDAVLEFAAPTEIRISGKVDSANAVTIGPALGSGINASDIVIYANDINGDNGNVGATPKAMDFGQNSVIDANLYAVNGTLKVRSGSEVHGALLGRWVDVGQNVTLNLDSAF